MIFNTIHKEIQNFNYDTQKIARQCSMNYNSSEKILNSEKNQQYQNRYAKINQDKNIVRQCIKYEGNYISKPLKKLSPQKTLPVRRSSRKQNKQRSSMQKMKMQKQQKYFPKRCRPEFYPRAQEFITRKSEQKMIDSQANYGLSNHLIRSKHNGNLEQTNNLSNLKYSQFNRQKQNSLSQTAISGGSQLFELSPIHFNKYMQYKDRQANKLVCQSADREENIQQNKPDVKVVNISQIPNQTYTVQTVVEIQYNNPVSIIKNLIVGNIPQNQPIFEQPMNTIQHNVGQISKQEKTIINHPVQKSTTESLAAKNYFIIWPILMVICGIMLIIAQLFL